MNMMVRSAAVVSAPSIAMAMPVQDADLDRLWRAREEQIRKNRAVSAELRRAREGLPSWAESGPMYIDFEGNRVGDVSGWPEQAEISLPSFKGAKRRVRVSPRDIKRSFFDEIRWLGTDEGGLATRREARARYRRRMLKLVARLREQRDLYEILGIERLGSELEVGIDRLLKLEGEISTLPPTVNQIVAWMVIRSTFDQSSGMSVNDAEGGVAVALVAMEGFRSQLTGAIRQSVDTAFDNPDTTFEDLDIISA